MPGYTQPRDPDVQKLRTEVAAREKTLFDRVYKRLAYLERLAAWIRDDLYPAVVAAAVAAGSAPPSAPPEP
jgi:hypothetical protein